MPKPPARIVCLLLMGAFAWAFLFNASAPAAGGNEVMILELEGTINPGSANYVVRGLEAAREKEVALAVIRLDTPGGLGASMRTIVKAIMNSAVPVAVYVSPTGAGAASAGVLVTIAANIAAMAPGTNIGAAHPVTAGGKDLEKTMSEKIVNDMVSYAQGIARKRGRNAQWVEQAVRESVSVTAQEAVKKKVVDLLAKDMDDLLEKINGWKVTVPTGTVVLHTSNPTKIYFKQGFRDRILQLISDPNISYILMMIGLAGLYFELAQPGAILPGVIGAISLILAFYSFQTLPVNYAGLLLIALALILFIAEIKVQSYAILSIGGIISLILGSLMLFEDVGVSLRLIFLTALLVGGFFIVVAGLAFRAYRRKPLSGMEGLMGAEGVVKRAIDPEGLVFVHGEIWKARSKEKIEEGEKIRVEAVDGLSLKVRRTG